MSLTHDQLAFLLDVARAEEEHGRALSIYQSSDGVVDMPAGVVALSYADGWRATLTDKGRQMVAAVRAKDRGAA